MEVIHMAHAGTIDLGKQGKATAAPGGGRLLAVGLIVVIAVATIAGVWFAIGSGLKSGTTTGALGLGSQSGVYDSNWGVGMGKPVGTSGSQSGVYDSNWGVWMGQPVGTSGSQSGVYDSNWGVWM